MGVAINTQFPLKNTHRTSTCASVAEHLILCSKSVRLVSTEPQKNHFFLGQFAESLTLRIY